jgi:hypothetical protein
MQEYRGSMHACVLQHVRAIYEADMYFVARPSQAGGAEDNLLSHGKFVHRVCYFF